jgi:hypothetical protein
MWPNGSHRAYILHFLYLLISWMILRLCHVSVISSNEHRCADIFDVSVPFFSWEYKPNGGIAGTYGSSIFNFYGKFHIVFHNGCTNLHYKQQCARFPFFPHPMDYLCLVFLIISIITGGGVMSLCLWYSLSLWLGNIFSHTCCWFVGLILIIFLLSLLPIVWPG